MKEPVIGKSKINSEQVLFELPKRSNNDSIHLYGVHLHKHVLSISTLRGILLSSQSKKIFSKVTTQ